MKPENQAKINRREGAGIVRLTERDYRSLDVQKLAQARALLLEHAASPDPRYLAVDLSAVRSVGASFIGLLVETWHELRRHGRSLVLFGVCPSCNKLLQTLQLDKLFEIYPADQAEQPDEAGISLSPGVRVQKSEVDWDPEMVRLEYFGGDGVPFRCVIVPRSYAGRLPAL